MDNSGVWFANVWYAYNLINSPLPISSRAASLTWSKRDIRKLYVIYTRLSQSWFATYAINLALLSDYVRMNDGLQIRTKI